MVGAHPRTGKSHPLRVTYFMVKMSKKVVITTLIQSARQALKHAYAPYSKFRVGAAVLADNGRVFCGCNIENASFGLTVCAERVAVFNAISAGARRLKAIAVVSDSRGSIPYPCGACLQVLAEFAPDIRIILSTGNRSPVLKRLKDFLKLPFTLHKKIR